jgi:hypothetical protein
MAGDDHVPGARMSPTASDKRAQAPPPRPDRALPAPRRSSSPRRRRVVRAVRPARPATPATIRAEPRRPDGKGDTLEYREVLERQGHVDHLSAAPAAAALPRGQRPRARSRAGGAGPQCVSPGPGRRRGQMADAGAASERRAWIVETTLKPGAAPRAVRSGAAWAETPRTERRARALKPSRRGSA